MILYLVRHGETASNRDGVGLGRMDVPLSERGRAQAAAVGEAFREIPIDLVLSSPLGRARDTAEEIAAQHGLRPVEDELLIELDVGETDGIPLREVRERYPEFIRDWAGPNGHAVAMPGGESLLDVDRRVEAFLGQMAAIHGEHVVAVSHNFVLRLLICRLLGLPPSAFRSLVVDLASISSARVSEPSVTLLRVNDVCHLATLNHA